MTQRGALRTLRDREAHLLARRSGPPEVVAAVRAALAGLHPEGTLPDVTTAGEAIGAAVEAHGAGFPPGAEPAYHDRHHQAEATLVAGWLAAAALRAGQMTAREAALLVLAMAGHDLLHEGRPDPGDRALERRAAERTRALAAGLPAPERETLARLIMATAPGAEPSDLAERMAREADLFASLTPDLGPRLSRALAAEWGAAGVADAAALTTHAGRCALLLRLPPMTPAARELGLEAARAVQLAALGVAGKAASPAEGARRLDAMAPGEAAGRWAAALAALGLPELRP